MAHVAHVDYMLHVQVRSTGHGTPSGGSGGAIIQAVRLQTRLRIWPMLVKYGTYGLHASCAGEMAQARGTSTIHWPPFW